MKYLGLILRICSLVLCIVALVLLFVPATSIFEVNMWGVSGYGNRIDLDGKSSYGSYNYFEAVEYLSNNGFDDFLRILLIALFIVEIGVIIAAFFVKIFRKIYFAAIPLILFVICLLVQDGFIPAFVISGPKYLGVVSGYRMYSESTIRFYIDFIPTIIMIAGAFVTHLSSGIYELLCNRKTVLTTAEVPSTNAEPVINNTPDVTEELLKLKELLAQDIITQEEFDAKKKQLLNL